jgi:hypothetical protein
MMMDTITRWFVRKRQYVVQSPAILLAASMLALLPSHTASQIPGRRSSSMYFGGDNVRLTAGRSTPRSGMRNWESGLVFGLGWESWDPGRGGAASRVAAGIAASYSALPFARSTFISDFEAVTGKKVTNASASDAVLADLMVTLRVRGPTLLVMPSLMIGVGYYDFRPSTIAFQATDSSGSARSRGKNGPAANIGIGLDGPFIGRTALFAEAVYAYGWSSDSYLGQSASSRCSGNVCDTFKSTQTTMLRGGVRVRTSR